MLSAGWLTQTQWRVSSVVAIVAVVVPGIGLRLRSMAGAARLGTHCAAHAALNSASASREARAVVAHVHVPHGAVAGGADGAQVMQRICSTRCHTLHVTRLELAEHRNRSELAHEAVERGMTLSDVSKPGKLPNPLGQVLAAASARSRLCRRASSTSRPRSCCCPPSPFRFHALGRTAACSLRRRVISAYAAAATATSSLCQELENLCTKQGALAGESDGGACPGSCAVFIGAILVVVVRFLAFAVLIGLPASLACRESCPSATSCSTSAHSLAAAIGAGAGAGAAESVGGRGSPGS